MAGSGTDINRGLSRSEVEERIKAGLRNGKHEAKTKTVKQIIVGNTCTLFNFMNFFLAACVLFVKSFKNLLFMGVILCNMLIGIVQEIRAKKTIDKLSLISAPKAKVIRDGVQEEIAMEDIVKDELYILRRGDQVCADSVVAEGSCDVDESLLTGENDPVHKEAGDQLLSGSFIISGDVKCIVVHVGAENYAYKIVNEAKYLKKPTSQMMDAINRIIKIVSICILPLLIITFIKQYFILNEPFDRSVISTVAATIAMIPEGLVLLTSIVLAVSVVRLSKEKTLVQELYCIETLARVNMLCLDKTGTITEGRMRLGRVIKVRPVTDIDKALSAFVHYLNDENATSNAIKEIYNKPPKWEVKKLIPFSSEKKWSLASFKLHGSYVLGAAEYILSAKEKEVYGEKIEQYSAEGFRVLAFSHTHDVPEDNELPCNLKLLALLLIGDVVKSDAKETLSYFSEQGVGIKIISGDNPVTVSNIAKQAGVKDYDKYVDATTLDTDKKIEEAAEKYTVFGRVSPRQKLLLVKALKTKGLTVGMTGDGVNDVLALKESDCSVAMQSGSDAARNVSKLVLLDSNFAAMPKIVAEGRRSINNLERSATLFLEKTVYAVLLALLFLFVNKPYPFVPIQLTLINALTIGVPSFMLALEPNYNLVKGRFFKNVMRTSLPGGLMVTLNVAAGTFIGGALGGTNEQISTIAAILTAYVSFLVLIKICRPFNLFRAALVVVLIAGFCVGLICFSGFFGFVGLTGPLCIMLAAVAAVTAATVWPVMDLFKKIPYFRE